MAPVVSHIYTQHPMWVLVLSGMIPAPASGWGEAPGHTPPILPHQSPALGVPSRDLPQMRSHPLGSRRSHVFLAWCGWGLEMPSLGQPSGMTTTIGVQASGRFCPSGCLAQPLYVLFQEMGGLQCSPMCLPSFSQGMVMWVLAPYLGPLSGFTPAAGPKNACSAPLWFLFWPGRTLPLPHLFFQGSADFSIKGLHLLWPIRWGAVAFSADMLHCRSPGSPPW